MAVVLWMIAEAIWNEVDHGPVIQKRKLGLTYKYDSLYGLIIGSSLVAAGWVVALAGMRYCRFARPFSVALISGTTLFGLIFMLHYCTSM